LVRYWLWPRSAMLNMALLMEETHVMVNGRAL